MERKKNAEETALQHKRVKGRIIYSLLSLHDSPLKEHRAGCALVLHAEAQREGAEREDRLLELPGTSTLPFPAPLSLIGAWNITSCSKC